jgi:hypothetical protein
MNKALTKPRSLVANSSPLCAPPDWEVLEGEGVRAEFKEEDLSKKMGGVCSERIHGRLRAKGAQWRNLARAGLVSSFVLSVVLSGYVLEWEEHLGPPPAFSAPNHDSVYEHANFVRGALKAALSSGAISAICRSKLRCIMPLGVAANAEGKLRLIYDARYVNSYVHYQKFKMEELHRQGRHIFAGQQFGSVLDISSAFHHIEVNEEFWEFLGFEFEGATYWWKSLPFGLTSAPRVFSMVMRPLVNL